MMDAMPTVMERCFGTMDSEEAGSTMQDMMPNTMESCLPMMNAQQQEEMLGKCREKLDKFEPTQACKVMERYLARRF